MLLSEFHIAMRLYDAEVRLVDEHQDELDVLYGWIKNILTLD